MESPGPRAGFLAETSRGVGDGLRESRGFFSLDLDGFRESEDLGFRV